MTRDPSRGDDAQRVVDALADLFDAVPPADRAAAEEELRAAGADPAAVGRRLAARAETARPQRVAAVRQIGTRPATTGGPRRRRFAGQLARVAALLALGVAAGWWAFRTPAPDQIVQRVPVPGRRPAPPERIAATPAPQPSQPPVLDWSGSGAGAGVYAAPPVSGYAGEAALDAPGATPVPFDASDNELVGAVGEAWVLDATTWERAKYRLPAPVLDLVKRGDYLFRVVAADAAQLDGNYSPAFAAASAGNADRYALAPGTCGLLDRSTQEPPLFYFGLPFPNVELNDAQAGCEIMWNVEAVAAVAGGQMTVDDIDGFPDPIGRTVRVRTATLAFVGRASGPIDNPDALRRASLTSSARGSEIVDQILRLDKRPMAADPDRAWIFQPLGRRIKSVGRFDEAYAGTMLDQNDRDCFDGRLEAFEWKLVDFHTELVPLLGATPLRQRALSSTRAEVILPDLRLGFESDDRHDGAWSVVGGLPLTERPVWVVEGTSRAPVVNTGGSISPSESIGRTVLYIDREGYRPYWKFSYSRATGELTDQILCAQYWSTSDDGERFAVPGTALLTRIGDSVRGGRTYAMTVRRRREILDQDLRGDWFSGRSMVEWADRGPRD